MSVSKKGLNDIFPLNDLDKVHCFFIGDNSLQVITIGLINIDLLFIFIPLKTQKKHKKTQKNTKKHKKIIIFMKFFFR